MNCPRYTGLHPQRAPVFGGLGLFWLLVFLAIMLAGCSTVRPEPVVDTVTVGVPVARSCVPPALGEAPAYIDTDAALKAAGGPEDRYQMVIAGRVQRNARLGEVEPVVKGCR